MNVIFYSFTKRPNSTKQPNPVQGKNITCQLKEETSFMNPTLIIGRDNVSGTFSPDLWNYVTIPYWQRHYFITDWQYLNGVWECQCRVDPLASFRSEIGATSAYVIRAADDYNGAILDSFYPATTDISVQRTPVACAWYNVAPSGGTYVLGCINYQSSNKVGAVSYYALNAYQLSQILNYLFTDNIFNSSSISEIGEGLFKSIFNPFQYIVSCMWFPFTLNAFGSTTTDVKVGYWSTGVTGIMVSNLAEKTFVTATIPNHPQASRGKYLNYAPYSRHTLYIPPFGSIPLDTNFRNIGNYLYSAVLIDHITGQCTIRVSVSPSSSSLNEYNIMCEKSAMMGVPIQLSQLMPDYIGTVNSLGGAMGSALTGNIIGAVSGLLSSVDSQMPKVSNNGANGSFVETLQYPQLISEFLRITNEDNDEFGRPLCSVRTLSSLYGYIKCGEDDHAFSGTASENEQINQYLKNGFFFE